MVALVGPNGAGKSTLVNTVSGLLTPASGSVACEGRVAQVPEGRQMFPDMSVEDNLAWAAWSIRNRDLDEVYDLLPDLAELRQRKAGRLSGGQQQMVAIGRALMARPDLLVIDELSLGLAPHRGRRARRPPALPQPRARAPPCSSIEQEVAARLRPVRPRATCWRPAGSWRPGLGRAGRSEAVRKATSARSPSLTSAAR